MAALEDFQFELDGYAFGDGLPIFMDEEGFDTGELGFVTQDTVNPITGVTMMGRDVLKTPDWSFALHVNQDDPESALAELAKLGKAATNDGRGWSDSRTVIPLRYAVGGRTRRVYGRPRRFSYKPNNRIIGGYMPPLLTFGRTDALHYDDFEQSVTLGLAPSIPGGLEWPAEFPMTFNRPADFTRPGGIVVGGDAPTYPVIKFVGPSLNPRVTIGTFKMGLVGTLGSLATVTIDTRPWAQTIVRTGSTSGVKLTQDTRLARAVLEPGSYEAVYAATDITGESSCQVRWRDAWTTL